jgi:hypothetical protein
MKLAMQILGECPHPNLLPSGEGTTSPIGERVFEFYNHF